jgi:thiol:disulfide interchange protein DsbD
LKKNRFWIIAIVLQLFSLQLIAQADSIVVAKVVALEKNDSSYILKANLDIEDGWHVYDNNTDGIIAPTINASIETALFKGQVLFSTKSLEQKDVLFGKAKVFVNKLSFEQEITVSGFQPDSLKGNIVINVGKGDQFYALEIPYSAALSNGSKAQAFQMVLPTTATTAKEGACGDVQATTDASAWSVFFLGFLGGLIALITPCVFPMIPVTVSFFTKRSKTKKEGIKNGILYGLSIFLIYVLASVPFHIIGNVQPEIFNSISTNATLNLIFFAVFIFFSISFFGYFEITLPSGIANKADAKSGLGSLGGIFFMAITLAIVSFSCTGPILGTLLVGSLQGGAWALTQGMAGFGLALALPFTLFAIFPGWLQSIPKSGGWLDTVKKILAFAELALAFKFLSNADLVQHWGLLKREVFLGIWTLVALGLTAYLFGWLRLPHDVKGAKIAPTRKVLGVISFAFAIYVAQGIPASRSGSLQLLSGFPPPTSYSIWSSENTAKTGLHAQVVNDYAKALQMAKDANKPLLIDFTGWACVNCRKMEENVWVDPAVKTYIEENFILVSLYVDDRANLPIEKRFTYTNASGQSKEIKTQGDLWATFQSENFKQVTQPLYVVLSPDQNLLSNPVGYTPNIQQYLEWLQCSVKAGK